MPWVNQKCLDNADINTFVWAQNKLNGLTPAQWRSAKVATSDDYTANAAAYVFYYSDAPTDPPSYPKGPAWNYKKFTDPSYDVVAQQVTDFLNTGTGLDVSQAYYAQVSANDHHKADPVLVVWYLDNQQ